MLLPQLYELKRVASESECGVWLRLPHDSQCPPTPTHVCTSDPGLLKSGPRPRSEQLDSRAPGRGSFRKYLVEASSTRDQDSGTPKAEANEDHQVVQHSSGQFQCCAPLFFRGCSCGTLRQDLVCRVDLRASAKIAFCIRLVHSCLTNCEKGNITAEIMNAFTADPTLLKSNSEQETHDIARHGSSHMSASSPEQGTGHHVWHCVFR